MSLQNKIETKLNEALKTKDKKTYSTLRLVVAAIKDLLIAKKLKDKQTLPDNDLISLLKKMVKQRNDSCEAYKKGGRNELFENEMSEIKIINQFLPKQLSEDETKKICLDTIKAVGANSVKDMGKVMGALKKEYSDVLDSEPSDIQESHKSDEPINNDDDNLSNIDLARALIESGEREKAKEIILNIIKTGSADQAHEARILNLQIS